MKYLVATVVIQAGDEFIDGVNAQRVCDYAHSRLDLERNGLAEHAHVVRSIVTKCYTMEEAIAVSRRGAP
ncbi:MAG: hypothetical protein GWN93_05940 [Deltaproteobacteria bacterium]|nr:hypothetical protein [Deltaproteobacteria bacterium]